MLNQDEQVALFVEAINENAQKLCKKLDKEAKKLYSSEIEKVQSSAQRELQEKINYSRNEIETQFNKNLALSKANARQALCDKRQAIAESVFADAESQIINFTQSEAYVTFLEKSLKEIYSYTNDNMEVLARSADVETVKSVAEKASIVCEVKSDDTIRLGGIKAESKALGKIFDDTLDQRLEEQKDWFFLNSKLSINI